MINSRESRRGAAVCIDALRIIERIAASSNSETDMDDWWEIQDTVAASMQHVHPINKYDFTPEI